MSNGFHVEWSDRAIDDWKRLSLKSAEKVAVAVQRFSETGEGAVVYVEGEFLLFVGEYVVVMLIDRDTVHVDGVRRA